MSCQFTGLEMPESLSDLLLEPFRGLERRDEMRRRLTLHGDPIPSLKDIESWKIGAIVQDALSRPFIPTEGDVDVAIAMTMKARAHYWNHYKTPQDYIAKVMRDPGSWKVSMTSITCFTGPAGVGKSSFTNALARVMPAPRYGVDIGAGHRANVLGCWRFSAEGQRTAMGICSNLAPAELMLNKRYRLEELTKRNSRVAYRDFIGLLIMDEMQSVTQDQLGSTRLTEIIWNLALVGSPFMFVANYSACHKLLMRAEEEIDRIMEEPMVLLPCSPDSKDWSEYLEEVARILGPSLRVNLSVHRNFIFRLSAGLKRYVVKLFVRAYVSSTMAGRTFVDVDDIQNAYDDVSYSQYRHRVESIMDAFTSSGPVSRTGKNDCPFGAPQVVAEVYARLDAENRSRSFAKAVASQDFTRTSDIRQIAAEKIGLLASQPKESKPTNKSPPKKAASAAELYEAELLRNQRKK